MQYQFISKENHPMNEHTSIEVKKEYASPTLVEYGDLIDLTRSGIGAIFNDSLAYNVSNEKG